MAKNAQKLLNELGFSSCQFDTKLFLSTVEDFFKKNGWQAELKIASFSFGGIDSEIQKLGFFIDKDRELLRKVAKKRKDNANISSLLWNVTSRRYGGLLDFKRTATSNDEWFDGYLKSKGGDFVAAWRAMSLSKNKDSYIADIFVDSQYIKNVAPTLQAYQYIVSKNQSYYTVKLVE